MPKRKPEDSSEKTGDKHVNLMPFDEYLKTKDENTQMALFYALNPVSSTQK